MTKVPPAAPRTRSFGQILARELDGTHPLVVIETDDEAEVREHLFVAIPESVVYRRWTAVLGLGEGRLAGSTVPDTDHPAAALAWLATKSGAERSVNVFYDLSPHLGDMHTQRALKEAIARMRGLFSTIVLVEHAGMLPAYLATEVNAVQAPCPDDVELEAIVRETLRDVAKTRRIEASVRKSTLVKMIRGLRGLSRRQASRVIAAAACEDDKFDDSDLDSILLRKRNALGDLGGVLEFVEAPVSLDAIGGLARLKVWLSHREMAHADEALAYGLRPPRGVLLLGVQGAGKSLAAKAIATAWGVPLLRLDAGALFDRFVGESERRLRASLAQADRFAPAVLWIDEIEKGFASAATVSNDGGLSRRMFGTLLTWMQERTAPTFLAATANDISALPPELLRKGRFDEVFFVDLPSQEVRTVIFSIHLAKRRRTPADFQLDKLAQQSDGFSGAEIESAIESAMREAFADQRRALTTDDILRALRASPPLSVVMSDRVTELREWATGRCMLADG
ncbi:MAG: AAA family ATPase [Phycisphaerae bacterium]|nr:AAA family ATPase [Phycisphaerae bacterium]